MPMLINSCTHDDEAETVIPPAQYEYGDDYVSTQDGYTFDKTHSSVRWETAYLGSSALLTGRFNEFELDIDFFEGESDMTSLSGSVVLSSVNTGEPGRDEGCLLGTFATDVSDEATFESTEVTEDGKGGYNVTGTLTFHGVTSPVTGTLEYVGTTFFDENSGVRNAPLNVSGFIVEFEFMAKSVFGIESSNIADRVRVIASGQFKKPL
ncbi:MAG: YceI family protein [Saprospiraceae bacterium]|nr:YceI family protein [Saprospiraceae bacterium]